MPDKATFGHKHPRLKRFAHWCVINPTLSRPRWWVRLLRPCFTNAAWSSHIYHSARMDVVPWSRFRLGRHSVVESFACVNNAMGDVVIGDHTRVGLHNTIIGPATIGSHVNLAQGVVVTAINHNFSDPAKPIDMQGVSAQRIVIDDDVWVGANVTITAGVTIGSHSVIGAGSVVTRDIPAGSVAVGSPAKVMRTIVPQQIP